MAADIAPEIILVHFAVSPGLLHSLDEELEVAFTEPRDAGYASIDVYETDSWMADGAVVKEEQDSGRMKRASIEGRLDDGTFTRTSLTQYFIVTPPETKQPVIVIRKDDAPAPAADGKLFFVTIKHSGTTSRVPIQSLEGDRERGYFELDFMAWVETSTTEAQTEESGWTSSSVIEGVHSTTVSIRAVEKRRAELVYIAATSADYAGGAKDYGKYATQYWAAIQDNRLSAEPYLESILEEIIQLPAAQRNDLPLGVVNIVSHGNETTWLIRYAKEWKLRSMSIQEGAIFGLRVGYLVDRAGASLVLRHAAPAASVLDERSLVIAWSCDVGLSTELMQDIRDQFGGLATVLAPKFHVVYRDRGGTIFCYLAEYWYVTQRGAIDWPDADILASRLLDKYGKDDGPNPRYRSWKSEVDWKPVASITSLDQSDEDHRERTVHSLPGLPREDLKKEQLFDDEGEPRAESVLLDLMFIETAGSATADEATNRRFADEYGWKFTFTKQADGTFKLEGIATLTIFGFVRALKSSDSGTMINVVPNIQNPDHFARVP